MTKMSPERQAKRAIRELLKQQGMLDVHTVNGKKAQNLRYAHKEVVEVAKGIAHELYNSMMQNNVTWAVWQKFCEDLARPAMEEEFVRLAWPHLLDDARTMLARLLGMPGKEHLKEQIHDVLVKDNLIRGTKGLVPVARQVLEANSHGR